MPIMTMDPIRMYETPKGIATVQAAFLTSIVGNDQVIRAAISGGLHKIRIMGISAQAVGAAVGSFILKSNTGGGATVLTASITVPPVTAGATFMLPMVDSGYGIETAIGQALVVDVLGAGINFNVFYIAYIP